MNVWYSLRLPPVFSYNALGFLKRLPNTEYFAKEKQSPFRLQRHTFSIHILHTMTKAPKL